MLIADQPLSELVMFIICWNGEGVAAGWEFVMVTGSYDVKTEGFPAIEVPVTVPVVFTVCIPIVGTV